MCDNKENINKMLYLYKKVHFRGFSAIPIIGLKNQLWLSDNSEVDYKYCTKISKDVSNPGNFAGEPPLMTAQPPPTVAEYISKPLFYFPLYLFYYILLYLNYFYLFSNYYYFYYFILLTFLFLFDFLWFTFSGILTGRRLDFFCTVPEPCLSLQLPFQSATLSLQTAHHLPWFGS